MTRINNFVTTGLEETTEADENTATDSPMTDSEETQGEILQTLAQETEKLKTQIAQSKEQGLTKELEGASALSQGYNFL